MGRLMQSVWAPAGDGDAVPRVPVAVVEETDGEPDEENIDATLHDGVLTVRVPEGRTAQPHRIEVKEV